MPRGNEQNLRVPTSEEAREIGRKGGIASGKARREKKTIQTILNDFLAQDIKDVESVKKVANKLGLKEDNSIKELFTLVSVMNSLKNADLSELEKLAKLLGEETEREEENNGILNELNNYLKEKNNAE